MGRGKRVHSGDAMQRRSGIVKEEEEYICLTSKHRLVREMCCCRLSRAYRGRGAAGRRINTLRRRANTTPRYTIERNFHGVTARHLVKLYVDLPCS